MKYIDPNKEEPKTLADIAKENPSFTFSVFYDVWKCPNSRERRQEAVFGISAAELGEKYGNFKFDHWYTTSLDPDMADLWATATEPEFLYDERFVVKRNVDEETPMSIEGPHVRVDWVNLGEGLSGDYNPEDPEDTNLLRFDVYVRNPEGEWEEVEDASYCTLMPADASAKDLEDSIRLIYSRYASEIDSYPVDFSVKKLGEELSWIGPQEEKGIEPEI